MISEINTLMYYVLYDHGRNSVLYEQYEKHKNIFLSGCLQMSQNNVRTMKNFWCLIVWKHGHWTFLLFSAVMHVVVVVEELSLLLLLLLLKNVLQLATATNNYDIYGHPHDHWAWALAWPMAIRIHWLNWGLATEDQIQYICIYKRNNHCSVRSVSSFRFVPPPNFK